MLLPAAKMLYGLSKDGSNDSRFRHHGVLRPLLQMAATLSAALEQQRQPPQAAHTALLYCSGCLKNISADATNQKSLGRLGGVATMAQVRVCSHHSMQRLHGHSLSTPAGEAHSCQAYRACCAPAPLCCCRCCLTSSL